MFAISRDPIDPAPLLAAVAHPAAGATVFFLGTVRDRSEGRRVLRLEYEAYEPMALGALESIGRSLAERFGPDLRVAIVHRIGRLELGEAAVGIAVSAPHRDAAYRASREAIEALKREVPIFKKEHFEGGEVWVEGPSAGPPPDRNVRHVILLTALRPEIFDETLVRAHVAHLKRLEEKGHLELCGPFSDEKGGMVILRGVSEEEARGIAEADPFVASGAETYELRRLEVSCRENRHMGMG